MWWSLVNTPWSLSSKVSSYWYSSNSGEKTNCVESSSNGLAVYWGNQQLSSNSSVTSWLSFQLPPISSAVPEAHWKQFKRWTTPHLVSTDFNAHYVSLIFPLQDSSIIILLGLIIFLGGCLDCDWTLLTPVLSKVS